MNRDRWVQLKELFAEAHALPAEEREAFLARVAADDPALAGEVRSLLAADAEAIGFSATHVSAPADGSGSPDRADAERLVGQSLGHFRIDEFLGAGGMGVVYRAYDSQLDRPVALKVVRGGSLDQTARNRLVREARHASALNHPNICTIYEIGDIDESPFIAMEYVDGQTLDAVVANGPLPVARAVGYASQIADALAHAHDRGIVHRDLKSANIAIGRDGRAKVLDFGVARRLQPMAARSTLTGDGAVAGTLAYMAPEVLRGETADARSDIWAFGVVLQELLTGRLPFRGRTGFELTAEILHEAPAGLPAEIPTSIAAVIARCLRKDRRERYQRATDVYRDLEQAQRELDEQSGQRQDAPSPSRVRERPIRLTSIVAALLVIVAALGYQLQERHRAAAGPIRLKLAALQGGTVGNVVGSGLVDVINRTVPGVRLEMIEVPATRAIRDLDTGQVQFAITTNLLAFHAVKTDQLLGHRSDAIAALTTAWAVPAQIVVRSDSDVKSLADLKGKRVSLDEADTNGRFASPLLLSQFGLNPTDVVDQSSGVATSLENMRQDRLDAYIGWRGVPLPEFTEAFTSGKFRLISLDPELLRALRLKHPFLTIDTLPPRLYPHQDGPVVTISSRILLIASRSLPDDLVNQVMTSIAAHMPDLIARHPAAAEIEVKRRPTIDDGLSIDLHPGAERFFASASR